MLDTETKRRIDTARDILVGKIPDPKSQVEQITIALIYKFMDDMDVESEDLGGERRFFTDGFSRYRWTQLMQPQLGGHETLSLYTEAIAKIPENPNIPPLFRDIFKNAYLPYRDPETLRSFLKIINAFTYDHSERLGDAFEYLLSVLGSQGDAGQFRTPRHIIDFIVEIIDPKKGESILDPACGTAGFLISAYKHILRNNTDKKGHSTLTPDDNERLAQNIKGYDISPDMVRLSLVNLYLHGFSEPHIDEYDTLTSEEKWNEVADVILANPPFMSPKGGIRPHKRFSVQSKRSEVLFVDYMAEHLTPKGRAGIIVPEGIIFQSQTAYKQLRKMLVENYLVAVVSLPAGVFNPYSGVKTSILILDRGLAQKSQTIGFFKVENDGYSLGAQRREIGGSQLPQVKTEIKEYLQRLRDRKSVEDLQPTRGLIVPKEKLAANGEYNLSGERYREKALRLFSHPLVSLGEVCTLIGGGTPSKKVDSYWDNGSIKWISSKHIGKHGCINGYELISEKAISETSTRIAPKGSTIIITRVSVGKFAFADDDYAINQDLTAIFSKDTQIITPRFIQMIAPFIAQIVERSAEGIGVRGVTRNFLSEIQIPLPPLEVQKEIVAEIEGYQKVIDGARAVVENYRPHIPIHPDWPLIEMGNVCKIKHGFAFKGEYFTNGEPDNLPILLTPGNFVQGGGLYFTEKNTKRYSGEFEKEFILNKGDLVVVMTDLSPKMKILGMPAIVESDKYLHNQRIGKIVLKSNQILQSFLYYAFLLKMVNEKIKREATGSTVKHTSPDRILSSPIPLPPLETQKQIVAEIEAEQALVGSNKQLIERFEKKIQATLARIWGEEEPDSEEA